MIEVEEEEGEGAEIRKGQDERGFPRLYQWILKVREMIDFVGITNDDLFSIFSFTIWKVKPKYNSLSLIKMDKQQTEKYMSSCCT